VSAPTVQPLVRPERLASDRRPRFRSALLGGRTGSTDSPAELLPAYALLSATARLGLLVEAGIAGMDAEGLEE
jgi:hypothetical protein